MLAQGTYLLTVECLLASAAGVVIMEGPSTPGPKDMYAVIGAMLATVIAILEARKQDRSFANTVCVFIGSSFIGGILPGVMFLNIWPERALTFTWHVWAFIGFGFGLIGWTLALACVRYAQKRKDAIVAELARKWLGLGPPKDPPQAPPP